MMEELKACPFCRQEVHDDDVKRAKAFGVVTYPCGTRKVVNTIQGGTADGKHNYPILPGTYQSKDCEIACLQSKLAEKDLEHKSLIREIQTVCGVDSLPPAPKGTGVNERALAVIGNALPQQEEEEVKSEASKKDVCSVCGNPVPPSMPGRPPSRPPLTCSIPCHVIAMKDPMWRQCS